MAPRIKGRTVSPLGYVWVYRPDHPLAYRSRSRRGYVLEHRAVVYDAGVALPLGRVVHHINHDRADNRLENLEVLTRGEHTRLHLEEDGLILPEPERRLRRLANWRRINAIRGIAHPEIACAECGTLFTQRTRGHLYCSSRCKNRANERRRSRVRVSSPA